jgi:hypothetical protein
MIEDYRMAHQHALSGPLMCVLGSEVRPRRIPLPAQPSPHLGTQHWSRCRDSGLRC